MYKRFLAALLVLCMVVSMICAGCSNGSLSVKKVQADPAAFLKNAMEITQSAWAVNTDKLEALLKSDKLTADVNADVSGFQIRNILNIDNGAMQDSLNVTSDGETMTLEAYYGNSELAVKSESILGSDEFYGLNLDTLAEQGTESSLAKMLELDKDTVDAMVEAVNVGTSASVQNLPEQMKALNDKIIEKYTADVTVAEQKLAISGSEIDAITITAPMTTELASFTMEETISLFTDYNELKTNELFGEVLTQLEQAEIDGSIVFFLNKKTGALMEITTDADVTVDGEAIKLEEEVVYGANPAAGQMDAKIAVTSDDQTVTMDMGLTRTVADNTVTYEMTVNADAGEDGKLQLSGSLIYNVSDKGFTLGLSGSVDDDSFEGKISGTAEVADNAAALTITSVKANDVTLDTDISVKLTAGTASVTKPAYTDLLAMDEDSLTDLFYTVILGDAYTGMDFDEDFELDEDAYYEIDSDICIVCEENECTQVVSYLGQDWNVCDECAKLFEGDFCDYCNLETSELHYVDLGDYQMRFCDNCWEEFGLGDE